MKLNVALVSLDPTVGALAANADLIVEAYRAAAAEGADIVLTPEMGLSGYPLQDLTQKEAFLQDVEAMRRQVIERIRGIGLKAAIVFGHPTDTGKHDGNRRLVYNSATFLDPTTGIVNVTHKVELPNYGVFDEKRNYQGNGNGLSPKTADFRGPLRASMVRRRHLKRSKRPPTDLRHAHDGKYILCGRMAPPPAAAPAPTARATCATAPQEPSA